MKLSELERGTRILIPCPQCGDKKSIIFNGIANYRKTQNQACHACANEENTCESTGFRKPNAQKSAYKQFKQPTD